MPEDTAKKSRQYITLKAPPSHRTTSQSGSPREEDDEGDEETEDQQPVTDRSLFHHSCYCYIQHSLIFQCCCFRSSPHSQGWISQKTQQSYKPMSPNAEPLPSDLQMKRESPMVAQVRVAITLSAELRYLKVVLNIFSILIRMAGKRRSLRQRSR